MQTMQKWSGSRPSARWVTALVAGCGSLLIAVSAQATYFGFDLDYDDGGWTLELWGSKEYTFSSSSHGGDLQHDDGDLESKYSFLFGSGYWSFLKESYDRYCEPSNPIPEPSAALVFGAGLLVFGTATRRRRTRG